MNAGACTASPVSSFAGLVTFDTAAPFNPGPVYSTATGRARAFSSKPRHRRLYVQGDAAPPVGQTISPALSRVPRSGRGELRSPICLAAHRLLM